MSPCFRFLALALGASLASVGCGEDTSGDKADGALNGKDGEHDAHHHPDAGEEEEDVPCTPEYPAYSDGMTAKAGDLTVRLVSVSPEPPRQQTPNNWALEVVDAAGKPVSGVTIDTPDSFMKVHNHHGRTQPKVVVESEPGRVKLNAIDFKMRGPWWVTFNVASGGKTNEAKFWICVE